MLEIRPAREADQSAIVQLCHQGWHDAHAHLVPTEILAYRTPAYFSLWLKQTTDVFHVAVSDELLGFAGNDSVHSPSTQTPPRGHWKPEEPWCAAGSQHLGRTS
ncbi:hypothetical protein NKJ06_15500 [Mesorhizobium sp. M0293]|uniref:hypothetical protein n=1 Tax=unclassified Mesorhizobium TaxID=325217 RepID=UPI0033366D05